MWSEVPLGDELRTELGEPRSVERLRSSPRSRVWLVERGNAPVVIKEIVAGSGAADRFERELAALRLAARVNPPVAPRLLATDHDRRVLVLEGLVHQDAASDWIVAYAVALAQLHAATDADDAGLLPRWSGPTQRDVDSFLILTAQLGVSTSSCVSAIALTNYHPLGGG